MDTNVSLPPRATPPTPARAGWRLRPRAWGCASLIAWSLVGLSGCGGGGGSSPNTTTGSSGEGSNINVSASQGLAGVNISEPQAHRLLAQASFGPTPASVTRVQTIGEAAWVDEQLAMPLSGISHVDMVNTSTKDLAQLRPRAHDIAFTWWTHALTQPDQLRQRVAYALSQIFVVSTSNTFLADHSLLVASYMDMLNERATGNFRDLLEGVALHPAMGLYLSYLTNRKEDAQSGRVPDENFAREVMQLMTIGLHDLNDDGTLKQVDNKPVETYTSDDVKGLAKVFTGVGWHRPPGNSAIWWECFYGVNACNLPAVQETRAMSLYPQEHSTSTKRFLGVTVTDQNPPDQANPALSIRLALDRLATHPNTAPFISKQLIQRLVTSNPSPDYVRRVSQVFRSSGGNLKAVVKAILLDSEARQAPTGSASLGYGKLREPVLRWAHLLRALPHQSTNRIKRGDTSYYMAIDTSSPSEGLSQTPMGAPSVFNFYRPGYRPAHTGLSAENLLAPEMQLATETSVVGYARFVAKALDKGWGSTLPSPDVQFDLSSFMALDDATHAARPTPMVDAIARRLLGRVLPEGLHEQVLAAVGPMPRNSEVERRRRAAAAILLIAVSPVFLVQQ